MSQFDHSQLLQLVHYEGFTMIFESWPRLASIFGNERALEVAKNILENDNAEEVLQLSDQLILLNFNGYSQEAQISIRNSTMNTQVQNRDKKAILREGLFQCLMPYRLFTSLGKRDIEDVIQITFQYLENIKLIPEHDILSKVKGLKGKNYHQRQALIDYLQIVDSSLYYSSKDHRLRSTQIISLILFLFKNKTERVLLQILTGEGKSTVVSCLAAILTISGKRVDIVTTSELLAKRDVEEKARFYDLMNLRACHNFQENQRGPKSCYQGNNIIYGTPHSFQVDILFDEYKKKKTRCKRPFDAIIVDEVDSMFVDQKGHQTLLATTYPGFSEFIYPMKVIWNKINSYPIYQEGDKTMMVIPIGSDQTITGQARQVMNAVIKDIREQFKNEIITEWRMEFINQSLDNWIKSAIIAAFVYKQKEHYFIKNKDIAPIDLKNTGVILQNVHWENGLHQFLQIKHGLNVSTEGMTSNFISNLAHFDRYEYLYGLTGTLGSDQSKKFLVETFNVQLMKVPPFKQRKLQIDEGMILHNQTEWARYIVDQIGNMMACERSVLLICESIHEVQLIKIALQNKVHPRSIQFLTTGEEKMRDSIDCKELIVATNLAGRGTDLKISYKLNERGGLHVIIGFMSANLRVEMQGRGRAGRNGCEGSSELAVNYTRYCQETGMEVQPKEMFNYSPLSDPKTIMNFRDLIQAQQMTNDRETVEKLRFKDRMFTIYCKGMDSIPDFQTNYAKQLALEEQWAMFLKKVENRKGDMRQALREAQQLVKKLVNNSQSYYNPNHEIARGTKQLCDNKDGNSYQRAIPHFAASTRNTNSTARIIGGTMLNACKLNQNPQDRDNIKECLRGFAQNKQEIKSKNEMIRGMNGYDNANKCFVVHHEAQLMNHQEQFRNQINIQNGMPAPLFNNNIQQINPNSDQFSQIQVESGQQRILNALFNHIQKIQQAIRGLGDNEFVKIKFEPIKQILDSLNGDKRQNEKALERFVADGLRFQLVAQKYKKKKVSWWKRALVFALGVLQIVCGAIILGATAGALTGFGVSMMVEGATQCFDALFRPQLLENLGKYYGKVALSYMFSLAMSGAQGMKELASLGKKGFTLFNNMPFQQFMSMTFSNAWKGMKILPGVLQNVNGAMGLISPGIRNLISAKSSPSSEQIGNPIRKIQQNKEHYKKKIDDMLKDENMQDADISLIKQRFDKDLTKIIQALLSELDKNLLAEVKNLQIGDEQVHHLVSNHIKQGLALSSSSQTQSIKQLFKKHLRDQRLAVKFSDNIKLKNLMKNALDHIRTSIDQSDMIELRRQQMIHRGLKKQELHRRDSLKKMRSQLTKEKNQLQNNKGNITPNQFNKKVEAFNFSHNLHNEQVAKFNQFVETELNKPQNWLYNMLRDKKAFTKAGRVDLNIANKLPIHEYTKNGLAQIQYIDSIPSFEKALEYAVYNEVVNYGQLIIDALHSCQSQIVKKLRDVASQFHK